MCRLRLMRKFLPLLLIPFLLATAAHADDLARYFSVGGSALVSFLVGGAAVSSSNPIPITQADTSTVSQANITNTCQAPAVASTPITLVAASKTIDIYTSSDCSILHVDWANGTATTADAAIYPGATYRMSLSTGITAFKVYGEGTSGTYSIVAK
jgi:hypothetical protein